MAVETKGPTATVPAPRTMPTSYWIAHAACAAISYIIIDSFWEFQDATEALAFYGVYHRYPLNQLVHFFGVPGILWSFFMFMVHIPFPLSSKIVSGGTVTVVVDYALVMAIAYELFYLWIDPLGGFLYAPVIYAMYRSSVKMRQSDQQEATIAAIRKAPSSLYSRISTPWYGTGKLMKFAAFIHFMSWYVQIHLGHKIIEGATPAVFESFGGALSVAPLFAFYEGLWFVGINQGLQNTTLQLVDDYTTELCSQGALMKVCETLS